MNQNLSSFLFSHNAKNTPITHTRIGNKDLNIYGGSFSIHADNLPELYQAYYHHVFVENKKEYLTEKQSGLCIAVDFDFHYAPGTSERKHSPEDIENIVDLYLDELKSVLFIQDATKFNVFVMEKPNVNCLPEKTKDGIHMLINVQMDHTLQEILRENVLEKIQTVLDLPLINPFEQVLDEGITKGTTNWQLYGSRKPDHEAYVLTYAFEVELDTNDNEFMKSQLEDFSINAENFQQLSVQNPSNPRFEINPKVLKKYVEKQGKQLKPKQDQKVQNESKTVSSAEQNQQLHKLNYFVDNGFADEIASHKNHMDFTKIGYALNNDFGEAGLELYLKMAEKYSDDFTSKEEEYTKKYQTSLSKLKNNSSGTIYYIFKEYNIELFKELNNKYRLEFPEYFKSDSLEQLIENSIRSQTEYDIACVLAKYANNEYVCTSIKDKRFYKFENHRWVEDTGYSLRNIISTGLHKLYIDKLNKLSEEISQIEVTNEDTSKKNEKLKRKHKSLSELCDK